MTEANEQTKGRPSVGGTLKSSDRPAAPEPSSAPRRGTRMRMIPCELAAALHSVVASAEELVDAIGDCPDIQILGCDFEVEYTQLKTALSRLPRYYEEGDYIWREIERDYRHDAPGG